MEDFILADRREKKWTVGAPTRAQTRWKKRSKTHQDATRAEGKGLRAATPAISVVSPAILAWQYPSRMQPKKEVVRGTCLSDRSARGIDIGLMRPRWRQWRLRRC